MNSLESLNNAASALIEYTDNRSARAVLDRIVISDVSQTITDLTFKPRTPVNITEIINYATAAVTFSIEIISNSSPALTGSSITFPTLPTHMSSTTVGDKTTLSGFETSYDWEDIKNFTWTLPSGYASIENFYLQLIISWYDEATNSTISKKWYVYDPAYVGQIFEVESTLIAQPIVNRFVDETLNVVSTLIHSPNIVDFAANISSAFNIPLAAPVTVTGSSSISSAFSMTADVGEIEQGNIDLSTISSITAGITVFYRSANPTLTAVSSISATPSALFEANAAINSKAEVYTPWLQAVAIDSPTDVYQYFDGQNNVEINSTQLIYGDPTANSNEGDVYVYDSNYNSTSIIPSAPEGDPAVASFGEHTCISDDYLITKDEPISGGIRIWVYNASNLSLNRIIETGNPTTDALLLFAIDGDTLAAGYNEYVEIYDLTDGSLDQTITLTGYNAFSDYWFSKKSLNGNCLAIAFPADNEVGLYSTSSNTRQATIAPSGASSAFGYAGLTVTSNRILIGDGENQSSNPEYFYYSRSGFSTTLLHNKTITLSVTNYFSVDCNDDLIAVAYSIPAAGGGFDGQVDFYETSGHTLDSGINNPDLAGDYGPFGTQNYRSEFGQYIELQDKRVLIIDDTTQGEDNIYVYKQVGGV